MKKVFKLLVVCAFMLLSLTSLAAEGASPVKNGAVSKDFTVNGETLDESASLVFNDITELEETAVYEVLVAVNSKTPVVEVIDTMNFVSSTEKTEVTGTNIVKTVNTDVEVDLNNAVMLTEFQNLDLEINGEVTEGNNIQATWEVPNLNGDLGDVYVMHYSTSRNVFEVIEPDKVDFENKAVTATFEDLSPVAVFYVKSEVKPEPTDLPTVTPSVTEPTESEESSNNSFVWVIGGIVVVALGTFVVLRKKNK